MPKFVKLTVLGCLLGMSAGALLASSLRDVSNSHLSGEDGLDETMLPPTAASSATVAGMTETKPAHPGSEGFAAPGMPSMPAHHRSAPLPPTWQSLLPGAIRL